MVTAWCASTKATLEQSSECLASSLDALWSCFCWASVAALGVLIACELVATGRVGLNKTAAWGEVKLVIFQRNYAAQGADGEHRVVMADRAKMLRQLGLPLRGV